MPSRGPAIDLADSGRFLGQHGHAESVQAEGHSTANGLDQRLFSGPAIKEGLIAFVTRQRSQLCRFFLGKKILRNKQCIRHGTHGFQVDTDIADLRAPTDGEQQAVTARRGVEDIRSGFETWFAIGIEAEHNFRWFAPQLGRKQTLDQASPGDKPSSILLKGKRSGARRLLGCQEIVCADERGDILEPPDINPTGRVAQTINTVPQQAPTQSGRVKVRENVRSR